MHTYDALAMFSGGLDSILAAKTIVAQGLRVLCLHFISPFFGHPERIPRWREVYGLDIHAVDVGQEYIDMMLARPKHGVGKGLNPCVDCKVLMLRHCRELMPVYGAKFLVTGEVKGQRPMSQRPDTLNAIRNDAAVRDLLLRPLSAKHLDETPMEMSGLVDRERLHAFHGRGRRQQMVLAKEIGVTVIPQPGGGCKLTELDSAKRYVPIFQYVERPLAEDFHLANVGRQFWRGPYWLAMGKAQADNAAIAALVKPGDFTMDLLDFASPFGVIRTVGDALWDETALQDAAALVASYSPKAVATGAPVAVKILHDGVERMVVVTPQRVSALGLAELQWSDVSGLKQELFGQAVEDDF